MSKRLMDCFPDGPSGKKAKKTEVTTGFSMDSIPKHHHHLGNNVFAVVNEFRQKVLVHVRQYEIRGDSSMLFPSKNGVTVPCSAWMDFPEEFDPTQPNAFHVVALNLLITAGPNGSFVLQRLTKDCSGSGHHLSYPMCLNQGQFANLKTLKQELLSDIADVTLCQALPKAIVSRAASLETPGQKFTELCSITITDKDVEMSLANDIVRIVKRRIVENICDSTFYQACETSHASQLGHECLILNHGRLFDKCGQEATSQLNIDDIAEEFCQENFKFLGLIKNEFVKNYSWNELFTDARNLYAAEDGDPYRWF